MSHIEQIDVVIADLDALKAACERLGVQFLANKKTYTWFGRSVGDYKLPEGFTAEELGHCEHAIKVPGVNYEVGVVPLKGAPGKFTLLYDFWGIPHSKSSPHDGHKLKQKFGDGLKKLIDAFSVEALKRKARAKGYMCQEKTVDGKIVLTVKGF